MSFGGALVNVAGGEPPTPVSPAVPPQTAGYPGRNVNIVKGGTLAATVGAFGVAAADCARLTTVQPTPAGAFALPPTFGPGHGNWTPCDADALDVFLNDYQAGGAAAASRVVLVTKAASGGDITVDIQNLAANPAVAEEVRLVYIPSGSR